jgi:hypothetical protein
MKSERPRLCATGKIQDPACGDRRTSQREGQPSRLEVIGAKRRPKEDRSFEQSETRDCQQTNLYAVPWLRRLPWDQDRLSWSRTACPHQLSNPTPMSTNDGLLPNWPDEWSDEEIVQRWEALLLVLTGCNRMADETIHRHTLAAYALASGGLTISQPLMIV